MPGRKGPPVPLGPQVSEMGKVAGAGVVGDDATESVGHEWDFNRLT
jgi:hypothetical protein